MKRYDALNVLDLYIAQKHNAHDGGVYDRKFLRHGFRYATLGNALKFPAMQLSKIPAVKDDWINVIIETPQGSSHKYTYEPETDVFVLKKSMPMGATFPFDFGFIPNTRAEDGDPVDVLVLLDEPAYPGCLVACRLIAVLEATQKERDGKETRNDRLVAVPNVSEMYADVKQLSDLSKTMEQQIAAFFINYNQQAGKTFTPLRWADGAKALELVKKSMGK